MISSPSRLLLPVAGLGLLALGVWVGHYAWRPAEVEGPRAASVLNTAESKEPTPGNGTFSAGARRLARLEEQKKAARENSRFASEWLRGASDADIMSYFKRLKIYGESPAMDWARQRAAATAR
jgi:hypothetical protein